MQRAKRWLLVSAALVLMLVSQADAAQPFKKVSIATTPKAATTTTTTTTTPEPSTAEAEEAKPTKNSKLTGIPQIDYIWDPNLPRELRGYNLSSYPFFSSVPPEEDIHFKCDGLHDGFYASIEHKCQLYHHCVYGIRHDFLCANFTAFDQKTFICHFVSDVDCENSQKYWSRNDDLYMATTTTSTTTTTTEPPPTPRRRPIARPLRPLRRPSNRRPIDDYYYDEDDEYVDDYYEERLNRRRKQRPRGRKPIVDEYEDEYDEKRSFGGDDDKPRRPSSRDRLRGDDDLDEDYDIDRRKYDRPKSRNKPALTTADDRRRKPGGRKPGTISGRPGHGHGADERRSFGDDRPAVGGRKAEKPRPPLDVDSSAEPEEVAPPAQRRLPGRRRPTAEKRPAPAPAHDDLDEPASGPGASAPGDLQDEPAEEERPKVRTTPKPLEEFVTPKAAPASVYARPRAPPRIARPVPVNEKKKFQYPVQKTATTASPAANAEVDDPDYYEDDLYEDVRHGHGHGHGAARRRIAADRDEDDLPPRRRDPARKPTRPTLRKPVTDKKPAALDEEEAEGEDEGFDSAGSASNERQLDSRRRRPFAGRTRGRGDDVDFVDDDYEERPLRPAHRLGRPKVPGAGAGARKGLKKPRPVVEDELDHDQAAEEDEDLYEPRRSPSSSRGAAGRRKSPIASRHRQPPVTEPSAPDAEDADIEEDAPEALEPTARPAAAKPGSPGRPTAVRVVKRPFLPSRGGSPYLPRGLQPVGAALRPHGSSATTTTDSSPLDMGSTISGVRLLEHGAPILRDNGGGSGQDRHQQVRQQQDRQQPPPPPRTTLPPRSPLPAVAARNEPSPLSPKVTLDELYENDYDVTLNDALNPTLKPLTPHQSHHHHHHPSLSLSHSLSRNSYQSAFAPVASAFVNNNQSPLATHHNNNYQHQQQHPNAYQSVSQPLNPSHQHQNQHQNQLQNQHQIQHQTQTQPQPQPQAQAQAQTQLQQQQHPNYNSDSYFSSTDIRRRAIIPAPAARSSRTDYRGVGARIAQHFYDDLDY